MYAPSFRRTHNFWVTRYCKNKEFKELKQFQIKTLVLINNQN